MHYPAHSVNDHHGQPNRLEQAAAARIVTEAAASPDTAVAGCILLSDLVDPHAGRTGLGYSNTGIPLQRQRDMLEEALRRLPDDDVH